MPIEQFHFLRVIRSVPEDVLRMLRDRYPGYYLDRSLPEETPYLMDHCQCGYGFEDYYVKSSRPLNSP